jgi:hypothetical protein
LIILFIGELDELELDELELDELELDELELDELELDELELEFSISKTHLVCLFVKKSLFDNPYI